MRNLIVAALVCGTTMTAIGSVGHAADRWTCNVFPGPKHFINKSVKPWGKEVVAATKGEVQVNFLPTSAAPPPKQIDAIVAGTFDCAIIFHGFTTKRAVGPGFGMLPFRNEGNAEQGSVAYWRTWQKHFEAKNEFADDDIKILSMFQFSGVHFFTSEDKPINSIADMKAQKMWALAGTSSRTMKAAGVNHVSGPASRMAEFTQTKVIQGIAGATRSGIAIFAGVQFPKFGTFTSKSMMVPSFAWMVSKKKWDSLSAETKKAVMSVSGEKLARATGRIADQFEAANQKKLAAAGIKEVKASKAFEAELMKAAEPQISGWIKQSDGIGVSGKQVLEAFDAMVRKLGS